MVVLEEIDVGLCTMVNPIMSHTGIGLSDFPPSGDSASLLPDIRILVRREDPARFCPMCGLPVSAKIFARVRTTARWPILPSMS